MTEYKLKIFMRLFKSKNWFSKKKNLKSSYILNKFEYLCMKIRKGLNLNIKGIFIVL